MRHSVVAGHACLHETEEMWKVIEKKNKANLSVTDATDHVICGQPFGSNWFAANM